MGRGFFAIPIEFISEFLVAHADQPVRMTLQGPTLLRLDARVATPDRATRLRVSEANNKNRETEADGASAEVELAGESDGTAWLLDGESLSADTVGFLPLNQKRTYHLVIRPNKGTALLPGTGRLKAGLFQALGGHHNNWKRMGLHHHDPDTQGLWRRHRATRTLDNLIAGRLPHEGAALLMRELTQRQKGEWLLNKTRSQTNGRPEPTEIF
jgi:hypothetical protein